jgi:hypothetical protein
MPAQAVTITEQTLIATGGDVVVTFVSNEAGFTSELFLDGALGEDSGALFNNWTTDIGSSVNLGSVAEGTELIFKLLVKETGDIFYTGLGSRNADGVVHATIDNVDGQVFVGFEDLFGGGDFDYDDLVFAFTNVVFTDAPGTDTTGVSGGLPPLTPGSGDASQGGPGGGEQPVQADEPGSLLLFGGGLAALVMVMRRQQVRR